MTLIEEIQDNICCVCGCTTLQPCTAIDPLTGKAEACEWTNLTHTLCNNINCLLEHELALNAVVRGVIESAREKGKATVTLV